MWKRANITRREFIKKSSLGLAGLSCLKPASLLAQGQPKVKALVLVELLGGADNTVFATPTDSELYTALSNRRGGLIVPTTFNLESYQVPIAMHPALSPLSTYIPNMRITMNCANASHVGTSGSHEAQQLRMALGGLTKDTGTKGWVARVFDSVPDLELMGFLNTKDVNYNCDSTRCREHPPGVFDNFESFRLEGVNLAGVQGGASNTAYVANILERLSIIEPQRDISPSEAKYRSAFRNLFPVMADIEETVAHQTPEYSKYTVGSHSYNRFAQRMRNIASSLLRMKIEGSDQPIIFVVSMGGWDAHSGWVNQNQNLAHQLGGVLKTFCDDLVAMDLFNDVVITTTTEFGRQLRGNGSGTDHGRGFPMLTLGGRIRGGKDALAGTMLNVEQINTQHAWPNEFDSRAVISDILEFHMGIDPYQTAFPGVLGSQFQREDFKLFI